MNRRMKDSETIMRENRKVANCVAGICLVATLIAGTYAYAERVLPVSNGGSASPVEEEEQEYEWSVVGKKVFYNDNIPLDMDTQTAMNEFCDEYSVPMYIVLGVMETESTFDSTAVNEYNNCFGYMQVNECNLDWLNSEIGVTDLKDPVQNIQAGTYILHDLYEKYGDWNKTLVCYNCGEAGAQEYVFQYGLTETDYSKMVLSRANSWRWILDEQE